MKKLENPTAWAGGYSLHLYCDHENDQHPWDSFPHEFYGKTHGDCAKEARKRGWKFHRDRTATCPVCAEELEQ